MVRRSMTSASMPCFASSSAAVSATPTMRENAVMVTASPGRTILALPIGTIQSGSVGTWKLWPYSTSFSRKMTGLGSRIAALSRPLASAADQGETTFKPGQCAYQLA